LNDLPNLGGKKAVDPMKEDFDDFGFDEDNDSDKVKKISGSKYNNAKAQKLLKDHEEEENKGYNMRGLKNPAKNSANKYETYEENDDI
jgi:hypothetical protein